MPNQDPQSQTVNVGFDPATQAFTFSQETVTFTGPGKLILLKDQPSDRSWSFSNVIFDGDGSQFPIESQSGNQIIIDDDYTALGTYSYRVVVTDGNNNSYTSQDPHIVNTNPQ